MSFPLPSSADLTNYIVYIGFDPIGAAAEEQQNKTRGKTEAETQTQSDRADGLITIRADR